MSFDLTKDKLMNVGHQITDEDRYSRGLYNAQRDQVSKKRISDVNVTALPKTEQVITSDAVTFNGSFMQLEAESGGTDTLSTVKGGRENDILLLMVKSGSSVTVKDEQDNLSLSGDFTLDDPKDKLLLIQGVAGEWHEIARSNNS